MKRINIHTAQLPNGLPFIVIPIAGTRAATTLLLVGAGSVHEHDGEAGVAHFLEHMMFKGTEKRPSKRALAEELDAMGAEYNAFTVQEMTGYYVKAAAEHWEQSVDVLSDMVLHSILPDEEVEREKGVITEELRMYRDIPTRHVVELFERALYGDHPLGRPVIGWEETITGMTRRAVQAFWEEQYRTGNAVLVVAGAVDEGAVADYLDQTWGDMNNGGALASVAVESLPIGPTVVCQERPVDQTHVWCGVPATTIRDDRSFAGDVLAAILAGPMSSRLFMEIREELGLAYSVDSVHWNGGNSGCMAVTAGIHNDRFTEALEVIVAQMRRFKEEPVGNKELHRAKEHIKGRLVLSWEESNALAQFMAERYLLTGRFLTIDEFFSKIDSVTADDIQQLAQELFVPNHVGLAVIAPSVDTDALRDILTTV